MFSVVVPCFNAKQTIRECLRSILSQTYRDFEVVVIDDGSDDGTAEILDEYSAVYRDVHIYHFANSGVSISRRRGIALASGEYIVFVDADDTVNSDLLDELRSAVMDHDFPDIIRYQANLVNDQEHKDHQRYNFTDSLNTPMSGIAALHQWSTPGKKYAVYWLFAFKWIIFTKVIFGTNLRCYEDVALIPVLVATSKKVVTIGYVGYNYTYNNATSLTNIQSIEAERSRALDFLSAYRYAIENFIKLDCVTSYDIAFFVHDYCNRLRGKFESLPESLKSELAEQFRL